MVYQIDIFLGYDTIRIKKGMFIMNREESGITLIALVITIIVLLILAGISIAMLTGENGILAKADDATRETEIAEAKEQAKLDIVEWTAKQLEEGKEASVSNIIIQEILTGKEYVGSVQTEKFTTKKNGYEILYSDLYSEIKEGDSEIIKDKVHLDLENTVAYNVGKFTKNTKNDYTIVARPQKYEKVNVPIKDCVVGQTYTIAFLFGVSNASFVNKYTYSYSISESMDMNNGGTWRSRWI